MRGGGEREGGWHDFIRLYSVLSEGGRLLAQQPDESKPLGKAAQKRLPSFPVLARGLT